MQFLSSRKLAGVIAAILGNLGVVLGLAVIYPEALTTATEVVMLTLAGITGLGGFQVWRQAVIDEMGE